MRIPALWPNEAAHIPKRPIHQTSFWPEVAFQEHTRHLAKEQIRFHTLEVLIKHQVWSRTLFEAFVKCCYAQDGLFGAVSHAKKLFLVHLRGTIFPRGIRFPTVHEKRRLLKCKELSAPFLGLGQPAAIATR